MPLDDQGWFLGRVEPLPLEAAYTIVAPNDDSRIDEDRLRGQAGRFFRAELSLLTPKGYPAGAQPRRDRARFDVGPREGARGAVEVLTCPLDDAPELARAAMAGAATMGGFDALVARGRRLWQCHPPEPAGEPRASLVLAAILASLSLGPILAPDGALFGVKGARERLARAGWPT